MLLPIYLAFLGLPKPPAMLTALYTLVIAFLMVSRLPVFSGKTVRMRVPPEMVLPVFVSVVFFIALLIGYPWYILSAGSVLYLLSLPAGWKSYRDHERKAAAAGRAAGGRRAVQSGAAVCLAGGRAGTGRSAGPAELSGCLDRRSALRPDSDIERWPSWFRQNRVPVLPIARLSAIG